MEVRVTGTARAQLLAAVVEVREQDRLAAAEMVDRVERTLLDLAADPDLGRDLADGGDAAGSAEGLRFLYRVRGDTLWVLAIWPDG